MTSQLRSQQRKESTNGWSKCRGCREEHYFSWQWACVCWRWRRWKMWANAAQYNICVLRCVVILHAPPSTWRTPFTHTCTHACWDIPVGRRSVTGFILFDLHSLSPEQGSAAWTGLSVARCSQSPGYQRRGSMALSLSAVSAVHRWLSMRTFSPNTFICVPWPPSPCCVETTSPLIKRGLHYRVYVHFKLVCNRDTGHNSLWSSSVTVLSV